MDQKENPPLNDMAERAQRLLNEHQHLVRYFVIGGSASFLDVVLFFGVHTMMQQSVLLAQTVSVGLSVLFSFSMNARLNFRVNDHLGPRLLSFSLVALIGYFLGYAIITSVATSGVDANIGKIVSLPFVFATQYILNSKITFRKTQAG